MIGVAKRQHPNTWLPEFRRILAANGTRARDPVGRLVRCRGFHVLFGNHFAVAGRIAFVWFHGSSAIDIFNQHMLLPRLMQAAALRLIAINCFSPLFGYHTGHGAVPLFGVTIVAATR